AARDREHAGLGGRSAPRGGPAAPPAGDARPAHPAPRPVHLGARPGRAEAARGDPGVPAGGRGAQRRGRRTAMAGLRVPDEGRTVTEAEEVRATLAEVGIDYERWMPAHAVPEGAPAEEVLSAYADEIERLKERGGYVTADVIDVSPRTPNLEAMLARFS